MEERNAKLEAQVTQMAERMAESRGDERAILHRLDTLEASDREQNAMVVTLQRQADAIERLNEKLAKLAEQLNSVSGRVSDIEKEPGDRWKKIGFEIIKYIVLAAVGAVLGYFMK